MCIIKSMKDNYEISRLQKNWHFVEFVKSGNRIERDILSEAYANLTSYERPDLVTHVREYVIGIEHFEFDKSKLTKKGSADRIKTSAVQKRLLHMVSKLNIGDVIHEAYSLGLGDENRCLVNIKQIFDNHYDKIDDYVKNIIRGFNCTRERVKIWFFMENMIAMPDFYDDGRSLTALAPLFYRGFVGIFENKPKLDGIIMNMDKYLYIVPNNSETISLIKKESERISQFYIHRSNPHVVDFVGKNN